MRAQGFTLVEVLVALVVLQVGLLGVVGTLVLASMTLSRASLLERGAAEMEAVLDSLARAAGSGSGSRSGPGGTVSWSVSSEGAAWVTFVGSPGFPHLEVATDVEVDRGR